MIAVTIMNGAPRMTRNHCIWNVPNDYTLYLKKDYTNVRSYR